MFNGPRAGMARSKLSCPPGGAPWRNGSWAVPWAVPVARGTHLAWHSQHDGTTRHSAGMTRPGTPCQHGTMVIYRESWAKTSAGSTCRGIYGALQVGELETSRGTLLRGPILVAPLWCTTSAAAASLSMSLGRFATPAPSPAPNSTKGCRRDMIWGLESLDCNLQSLFSHKTTDHYLKHPIYEVIKKHSIVSLAKLKFWSWQLAIFLL